MANFGYTEGKHEIMKGTVDFDAPDDFRVLLAMTNTTTDTEEDAATISAFTTLDEYDGSGYARQSLGSDTLTKDTANDRSEYDAADSVWSSLGAGTRQANNMVLLKHVTDDTDSIPIGYIDTGGFPFDGNGGDVTSQWNAEGIIQLT